MAKWIVFIIILLTADATLGFAIQSPLRLFQANGKPVENYNQLIAELKAHFQAPSPPPIEIIFDSNGKKFTLNKVLGEGVRTLVLSTGSKALRLPLDKLKGDSLDDYYTAWKTLKMKEGTSSSTADYLPHVFDHQAGQYTLVEKVEVITDYAKFTEKYDQCRANPQDSDPSKITEECNYCKLLNMNLKLLELVHHFSDFVDIGDTHKNNVVFVIDAEGNGRWILLDFASTDVNGDPAISQFSRLPVRKKPTHVQTFRAFQNIYETVHPEGKSRLLDLREVIGDLVKRARLKEECPRNRTDFIASYPLFQDLQILCQRWMSQYNQ
jgi:hypothetical protein